MARKRPIYNYPRDAWYVFAYRLSDPVHLGFIKNYYQDRLTEIESDSTLTTSETQDAMNQLLDDQISTLNWYAWDNCDRSQWFDSESQARAYAENCRNNTAFAPLISVMSPDEFESAMASTETDARVQLLKHYLLSLRDAPEPPYRVT